MKTKNHKKDLKSKIHNSVLSISEDLASKKMIENSGLLSGEMGISLFFCYLYSLSKKENHLKNSIKCLNYSMDSLEKTSSSFSFSNGLSGFLWGVNNMIDKGILEPEDRNILDDEIIDLMKTHSISKLKMGDYDFLHSGLGITFGIMNSTNYDHRYSNVILSEINNISSSFINNQEKNLTIRNLSLSHGFASIIAAYTLLASSKEYVCETLHSNINWLLKIKDKSGLSCFPNHYSDEAPFKSRLAWCYGDLGIASVLWKSGKFFDQQVWKNEAIEIMLHASLRKDLKENNVFDASVCHGSSGIAHIFNRFYKETKIEEFDEARWYWLEQTLLMAKFDDGISGYKTLKGSKGWQNEYNLLEGVAGVGLVLLGFLTDDIEIMDWDKCLLIS